MGVEISKTNFTEAEYLKFSKKLQENLLALKGVLEKDNFGVGSASLGAELELYIIDQEGKPAYLNEEIQSALNDTQLTLELNRYNLEYNLTPYAISNQAFFATEQELNKKLNSIRDCAQQFNARILPIGILPSLQKHDIGLHSMTNRKRYEVLADRLYKSRGDQFEIDIDGEHPLKLSMDDMTLEGANTSFQVHYRVDPKQYADTYNSFQLVTPLVLALAGNSPSLFGHNLWHETRIPLFKQSIDTRHKEQYNWHQSARVKFGHGWVRKDAFELFAESVRIYHPLLPICSDESPLACLASGKTPSLDELKLHQSTVWAWTRAVYDDADNGHLRVELRSLPAGPSVPDMIANAAFYIGMAEGIKDKINDLLPALPFELAEYNFYQSAQDGLNAKLVWPFINQSGCCEKPIIEILEEYLDVAKTGLSNIGVSDAESSYYLNIIKQRIKSQQTGSTWQRNTVAKFEAEMDRNSAIHKMLELYLQNSCDNKPVAEWA